MWRKSASAGAVLTKARTSRAAKGKQRSERRLSPTHIQEQPTAPSQSNWQANGKGGPVIFGAGDFNGSAVRFNDGFGDGETKTGIARSGA